MADAAKFVTRESISTNADVRMDLYWENMDKIVSKVRCHISLSTYALLFSCSCSYIDETSFDIINVYYLVHPCDEANNGGCGQVCNKRKEKHECSCEAGFVLQQDKTTCKKGMPIRYICMRTT